MARRNLCGEAAAILGVLVAVVLLASGLVPCDARVASRHTSNFVVIVDTSRFWHNYRHVANALSMYHTVKRLGVPDSQIILMLADDAACNPRNAFPGAVFNSEGHALNVYGEDVEVDYRGYDVSVETFIRLLTDRVAPDTPRSKRLLSTESSNVLIYMTGHGGDEFLKFQDGEEISSYDIADAISTMHAKGRYNEILFMADTCQAATLFERIVSPNVIGIGSSVRDQSSYAYSRDADVGVPLMDRMSYFALDEFEKVTPDSKMTLLDLFETFTYDRLRSTASWSFDRFQRPAEDALVTDFWGAVKHVEVTTERHPLAVDGKVDGGALGVAGGVVPADEPSGNRSADRLAEGAGEGDDDETGARSDGLSSEFLIGIAAIAFGGLVVSLAGL